MANKKYDEFLNYVQKRYPKLLFPLISLGAPKVLKGGDAAAAICSIPKNRRKNDENLFTFVIREDILNKSSYEELVFIFMHELSHITLGHMVEGEDEFYEDKYLFNLAADCIINDGLLIKNVGVPMGSFYHSGFGPNLHPCSFLDHSEYYSLCFGAEILRMNTASMSVREVYELLLQERENNPDGIPYGEPTPGSGGDLSPEEKFDLFKKIRKIINEFSKDQGNSSSEENGEQSEDNIFDNLIRDFEEIANANSEIAGLQDNDSVEHILEERDSIKTWSRLLRELNQQVRERGRKRGLTWNRRHKAKASLPDNVKLRGTGKKYHQIDAKPFVVVYVDTSGSIGDKYVDSVLQRVAALPSETYATIRTFSCGVLPFDIEKGRTGNEIIRGGTNFSPIMEDLHSICDNLPLNEWPEAVLIITDGYFSDNDVDSSLSIEREILKKRIRAILIEESNQEVNGIKSVQWDDFFTVKRDYEFF